MYLKKSIFSVINEYIIIDEIKVGKEIIVVFRIDQKSTYKQVHFYFIEVFFIKVDKLNRQIKPRVPLPMFLPLRV